MSREARIGVRVRLREDKVPETILWSATDAPFQGERECDALLLSIWDPADAGTLSVELWTERLTTDEMHLFVLQTLAKLAATVRRATRQEDFSDLLEECADRFASRIRDESAGRNPS